MVEDCLYSKTPKLDANAADTDSLLVTYTVDLRPVLSATIFGSDMAGP